MEPKFAPPFQEDKAVKSIGIIGFGDMGRLYATTFQKAGWKNIFVCDVEEKYKSLSTELFNSGIAVLLNGYAVARQSDIVIFSVEAAKIDSVVQKYGPSMKLNAIASGQVCFLIAFKFHSCCHTLINF